MGSTPPTACARAVRTDRLEASKVDGSYADHNNKITVAECARDWDCDPPASRQSGVGPDLGAHCIHQARRQEDRCRSFERRASVGDRAVAGLVSGHGAAPMQTALSLKCWRPRSSSGAQSGPHQSAFQDHSERIITLHPVNGNRCWPTASGYFHIYARRPGRSPPPLQSAAGSRSQRRHTRLTSRLIPVFSGVYSWFHLQCVFGILLGVGNGWQVVMILGPDHVLRTLVNDAR